MVDVIYRKCSKCGIEKPATREFFYHYTKRNGELGLRSICIDCDTKQRHKFKEKNPNYTHEYYEKHKERYRIIHKEYRLNNYKREQQRSKQYYIKNKEIISKKSHERYFNNRDKGLERSKKYYRNNKDNISLKIKERNIKKGYEYLHRQTNKFISKYNLRPNICSICGSEYSVDAHHPNNEVWNEVVFVCRSCHNMIHSGAIQCPEPIDLLKLI